MSMCSAEMEEYELREHLKLMVSKERYDELVATRPSLIQLRGMFQAISQSKMNAGSTGIGSFNPVTKTWET